VALVTSKGKKKKETEEKHRLRRIGRKTGKLTIRKKRGKKQEDKQAGVKKRKM